jgi:hypothetical protein
LRRRVSVALAALLLAPVQAGAEDYVTLRGAYYREPSTRVIQPVVDVERDSDTGIDVGAHLLIDAITSASASAGTAVDNIFTEVRSEAGLRLAKRWARFDLGIGYKYSAESDYWAHAVGLGAGWRLWGDTARVAVSLGAGYDNAGARGPARCPGGNAPCTLNSYFLGLTYSQVLSPVALAQVSLESAYLDGFQGNLYRNVPMHGVERLPRQRLRNALSVRGAYYFPSIKMGIQGQLRPYVDFDPNEVPCSDADPWCVKGLMIEGRVYKALSPTVEARLSYRQYLQSKAGFWCDTLAPTGTSCYPGMPTFYSSDVKLGPVYTEYPEAKLLWSAQALAGTPILTWFASGTFEISYGYYIQSTTYHDAHVLQLGYKMTY